MSNHDPFNQALPDLSPLGFGASPEPFPEPVGGALPPLAPPTSSPLPPAESLPPLGNPLPPSPPIMSPSGPTPPKGPSVPKATGLDKCPSCGSTHITWSLERQALVCGDCRHEDRGTLVGDRFGDKNAIAQLRGNTVSSGAMTSISQEVRVTIECQGCGAEIDIDTDKSLSARCHWCRQQLSLNNQVPNGAVPDGIIPFRIGKEQAMANIKEFVGKRKFFAHPKFKEEFTPENTFGIYLPYVIADANFSGQLTGEGQEHVAQYTRGSGNNEETYYDYNVYRVLRGFNLLANDLHLEASSKRQIDTATNTNNVVNAVLPFPIEEALDFRANYLQGYQSERRDLSTEDLSGTLEDQLLTVLRGQGDQTVKAYSRRGVRWETEEVEVIGTYQAAIYLPLWLYSWVEPTKGKKEPLLHYIAVNGVTGKTMGSVPLNKPLHLGVSLAVGVLGEIPFLAPLILNAMS